MISKHLTEFLHYHRIASVRIFFELRYTLWYLLCICNNFIAFDIWNFVILNVISINLQLTDIWFFVNYQHLSELSIMID